MARFRIKIAFAIMTTWTIGVLPDMMHRQIIENGVGMRMNTFVLLLIVSVSALLSSCDSPVSCVPADVSQTNARNSELNLSRRVTDGAADGGPIQAKNPQVRVYLDVSYSLRGFITGATCRDCAFPSHGAAKASLAKGAAADRKADPPFNDPLFATLVINLTNLPLRSMPGAPIQYYAFSEKLNQVDQEVYSKISREPDCYDQNKEIHKQWIESGMYEKFKTKCFFDFEKNTELTKVGDRNKSPFQDALKDIVKALEDNENPVDEGLFIIATDLFIAKNQDAIGPNSSVVAPLARLVSKGYQIRLFGFQLPFSGRIDDVPSSNFRVRGRVPFYYLAIGTPKAVNRFHRQVMAASEQIQVPTHISDQRQPLSLSDRFRSYAIGGSGLGHTSAFSVDYGMPSPTIGAAPVVISTDVDAEMEVQTSDGTPVSVTWKRPSSPSTTIRPPIHPATYQVNLLAWRWTRQATDGDACSLSWELVPRDAFNPGPLTSPDPDTLSMELFRNIAAGVERGIPYIFQLSLLPIGAQRDFGWIDAWSSDVSTMNDDLEAAKSPGAFIRTYNLSTLLRSLAQAAPPSAHIPVPPLASSVLAVRFK